MMGEIMITQELMVKYLDAINKTIYLLRAPEKWHQGRLDIKTHPDPYNNLRLDNALYRACDKLDLNDVSAISYLVSEEIKQHFPDRNTFLGIFNDHIKTSYEDVMLILDATKTQLELDIGDSDANATEPV